ncbi:hypothetical protein PVK06_018033 [Gossypium arboreum]|uniref:DUF4220 domain-containing protein n=1 Tax=Gossypium arboreum TaxID=29729 RepID=A0ABR0Q496_GOSAR|nr:hypothetical protein PVK06_018033 [Gossypium arboreum]
MIPTIVGSLILVKKSRKMMEVFSPSLMKLWKEWELRAMVITSLVVQILLISLGKRRKSSFERRVRAAVWCSYLLADSVATIGLGILTNDLADIYDTGGALDLSTELKATWAPFLLLHLGGPDAITAYSLEDNQLWLRHLFGLIVQTIVTIYIFFMAWTGSLLSKLTIPMIAAGSIKYAERTWTLWRASAGELRDSMLSSPDPGPNYPKLMDEYSLRKFEGFLVTIEEVKEDAQELDITAPGRTTSDQHNIIKATVMFQTFKRLFADLILSFKDKEKSQHLFEDPNMSSEDAFDVVAIELGFMYDLLYTKAKVNYTRFGLVCRFTTVLLTCLALGLFSNDDLKKYEKADVYITFLLLVVAILLEICAALLLLCSDQTSHWLIKNNKTFIIRVTRCLTSLFDQKRWSGRISQYSLLSHCLEERPGFKILEKVQLMWPPRSHVEFNGSLRETIFSYVKAKFEAQKGKVGSNLRDLCRQRGKSILQKYEDKFPAKLELEWSIDVDFDQSILIWHIATDICYNSDLQSDTKIGKCREASLLISNYLIYLLLFYPRMLPSGIGLIRFRDTDAEARRFFKERQASSGAKQVNKITKYCRKLLRAWRFFKGRLFSYRTHQLTSVENACSMLVKVKTDVYPSKVKGDQSKSVLFDACKLASTLKGISDEKVKWEMIREIWLEMLTYAASQCGGTQHADQLIRGGELLTHVWLLMAHFGITEQLQISKGHARALLSAN